MDAKWLQSVITVGGGRGFVVTDDQETLVVVTAAHCLPSLPIAHAQSTKEERTCEGLLGPLRGEPSISAEVLFVDPIADIAILGTPDSQELFERAEAYNALVGSIPPLQVATLEFRPKTQTLGNQTISGPPEAEADAWLLGLDGEWFSCRVTSRRVRGAGLWVEDAAKPIVDGMSGSPIMVEGGVIGIVCLSDETPSDTHQDGPQPYLPLTLPGLMRGP